MQRLQSALLSSCQGQRSRVVLNKALDKSIGSVRLRAEHSTQRWFPYHVKETLYARLDPNLRGVDC